MSYGIKQNGEYKKVAGNSGSGGTTDYTELENKPSINDVELSGNKSADDLGLINKHDVNSNWQGNGYNLIPYPYYDGSPKETNGITFTVNSDGSVTANGTATANAIFYFIREGYRFESGKKYRLSGSPAGGSFTTHEIQVSAGVEPYIYRDNGDGVVFTSNNNTYAVLAVVRNGNTVSNLTFKPMITEVDENDNYPTEYQRYALGNVELTQQVNSVVTVTNWNSLKEGFNAVFITQGTVLGDFTAPNNMRGYIVKRGINGNGYISDYNDAHRYFVLYSESFTPPYYWRVNPVDNDVYSTSERVVGKWIDGKPLYEITFDAGNIPNNDRTNVADLTSYSIKYVVEIKGFCYKVGDYNTQRPLPLVDVNPDNSIRVDINPTSNKPYLRILTAADWTGYKGYLTIKYTKTTD